MIRVTRRYRFSASHRLHSQQLSETENCEMYGKCNNPFGHGHDYVLDVTAAGPIDEATGQVLNPATLDALVNQYALRDLRESNLNVDVEDFSEIVPTSENVAALIASRLARNWHAAFAGDWPRLAGVKLRETRRNSFEILT